MPISINHAELKKKCKKDIQKQRKIKNIKRYGHLSYSENITEIGNILIQCIHMAVIIALKIKPEVGQKKSLSVCNFKSEAQTTSIPVLSHFTLFTPNK